MIKFESFSGFIIMIDDFWINQSGEGAGCYKLMTVEDGYGAVVNFVVPPSTYFVEHVIVIYGAATKSIPAQTIPYKIIVMC